MLGKACSTAEQNSTSCSVHEDEVRSSTKIFWGESNFHFSHWTALRFLRGGGGGGGGGGGEGKDRRGELKITNI